MYNFEKPVFDLFEFFEKTPLLVCIAGRDAYLRKINRSVVETLEYSEEELLASPVFSFMHPDDRELTGRERDKMLKGNTMVNFSNRYITKTGKTVWLEWNSVYVPEKDLVFAIAQNVSERKMQEKETAEKFEKVKALASRFKTIMEDDRKYLAMELHEELAQLAAIVKVDIEDIAESTLLDDSIRDRLKNATGTVGLLIDTISRISFSLSPNMIDDIGLSETLSWYCREFGVLNGINCVFENDFDETVLSREFKFDFFRICQKALANVVKHARARNAWVKIQDIGGQLLLSVTDNGKGFDTTSTPYGEGLERISERIASFNGKMKIESEPGKGTILTILVEK